MTRTEPVAVDSIRSSAASNIRGALLRRSDSSFLALRAVSFVPFVYRWNEIENYF
jgi:hypothetical protein